MVSSCSRADRTSTIWVYMHLNWVVLQVVDPSLSISHHSLSSVLENYNTFLSKMSIDIICLGWKVDSLASDERWDAGASAVSSQQVAPVSLWEVEVSEILVEVLGVDWYLDHVSEHEVCLLISSEGGFIVIEVKEDWSVEGPSSCTQVKELRVHVLYENIFGPHCLLDDIEDTDLAFVDIVGEEIWFLRWIPEVLMVSWPGVESSKTVPSGAKLRSSGVVESANVRSHEWDSHNIVLMSSSDGVSHVFGSRPVVSGPPLCILTLTCKHASWQSKCSSIVLGKPVVSSSRHESSVKRMRIDLVNFAGSVISCSVGIKRDSHVF